MKREGPHVARRKLERLSSWETREMLPFVTAYNPEKKVEKGGRI